MKKLFLNIKEFLFIAIVLIVNFFNLDEKIEAYIPNFHRYLISAFILVLLWNLFKKLKFFSKVIDEQRKLIYLTTNNDYSRKVTSMVLGLIGIILCSYLLLFSSYFNSLDVSFFLVISSLTFISSFIVDRSLKLSISSSDITYKTGKVKKKFPLNNLEKIEFSNTTIYFTKQESNPQEVSFLEITNKDLKTSVRFLKTILNPHIIITIKE